MAATAGQIARLRRMVAEPDDTTYDDDSLTEYVEAYPVQDSEGNEPDDEGWTATYDLHAAAADIWEEKAASLATRYDLNADGAALQRSQLHTQAAKQAAFHRARRRVVSAEHVTWPAITDEDSDEEYANVTGDH